MHVPNPTLRSSEDKATVSLGGKSLTLLDINITNKNI